MPSFFSAITSLFAPNDNTNPSPTRTSLTRKPDRRAAAAGRIQASTADAFSLPSYYGEGDGQGREGLGLGMPERGYIGRDIIRSESPTSLRGGAAGHGNAAGYAYPPHAVHPPSSDRYEYEHGPISRRHSQQPLYAQSPAVLRSMSGAPRSRPTSQLSTSTSYITPNGPLVYYPPLNQTWARIKGFLGATVPEMVDTLNYPVQLPVLHELEKAVGCALPPSVRDSYLCVDGQDPSSECREGLFFGLTLFSLEDALREWTFWRSVDADPATGANPEVLGVQSSIPPGWIRQAYSNPGWLPLIGDKCGNYVGVDLDPASDVGGSGGSWGQVIVFGRDFDRKCVLWRGEGEGGWGRWLAGFAEELERGEGWELDGSGRANNSDGEENGEDEIGYSSYYFDGSKGGGGDVYGSSGGGLRLTGEYRGWGVLEAFWDRSVRRWTELGMGLAEEAFESANGDADSQAEGSSTQGLGFGAIRTDESDFGSKVAIPVLTNPDEHVTLPPSSGRSGSSTPALLGDGSPLLPSASDEAQDPLTDGSHQRVAASLPRHLVVPFTPRLVMEPPTDPPPHDSAIGSSSTASFSSRGRESMTSQDGLLLPPSASPPRRSDKGKRRAVPGPAPVALDLPTRADVQAAQAVALAEETGLRGGWVMSMEAARSGLSARVPRRSADKSRKSGEEEGEAAEMVDIDLEGGQRRGFGKSPRGSAERVPQLATAAALNGSRGGAASPAHQQSPEQTPRQGARGLPGDDDPPRLSISTGSPALSAHSQDDGEETPQDDSVTDEMATISLA